MADYQPLLQRAVEALSDRSPQMRRAVYERARTALLEQLRSLDPPLSDEEIARERRALDEAIGRIEAGYAPAPAPAAPPPPAPAAVAPPPPAPPRPAPAPPVEARRAEPPRPETPAPAPKAEPPRPEPVRAEAQRPEPAKAEAPKPEPARVEPPRPRLVERAPDPRLDLPEAAPPPPGTVPAAAFSLPERRRPPAFDDLVKQAGPEGEADADQPARERPRIEAPRRRGSGAGRIRSAVLALVLLTVVGTIAVAAWLLREEPDTVAEAPPVVEAPATPDGAPKNAERLGAEQRPASAAPAAPAAAPAAPPRANDVPVAQRAILYEENPANPQQPRASAGRAVWRLDAVPAGQGQPLETAVRATVEVPDAGMSVSMLIRRNLDTTLPASHTIELVFSTGADANRVVRDVALPQMKNEEAARGAPIAGLPVPVKDNLFLIGLSSVPTDTERNRELLLRRNWVDLPVRLASGARAIISFEKGVSGDQILAEAFRQWGDAQPR
jgi:hypothetical protein